MPKIIVGIRVEQRENTSLKLQEILTKFGCLIKTRIGFHETDPKFCASDGLIILELVSLSEEDQNYKDFLKKLSEIPGINFKTMKI